MKKRCLVCVKWVRAISPARWRPPISWTPLSWTMSIAPSIFWFPQVAWLHFCVFFYGFNPSSFLCSGAGEFVKRFKGTFSYASDCFFVAFLVPYDCQMLPLSCFPACEALVWIPLLWPWGLCLARRPKMCNTCTLSAYSYVIPLRDFHDQLLDITSGGAIRKEIKRHKSFCNRTLRGRCRTLALRCFKFI